MMATAHARLMTAVDLTSTAPPEDPAAPIVHQVRGPDGEADMFEVRLRVPSQAPYVCFPLQHRKLIWRSAGLDVNLWDII